MTKEEMLKKLKGFIYFEHGTARGYALSKGLSPSFISAVLTGKKEITEDMLKDIDLFKSVVTTYKRA